MKTIAKKLLHFTTVLGLCTTVFGTNAEMPFKIRGIAKLGENYLFSVYNTATTQSKWLEKNQSFGDLVLLNYNPDDLSIEGLYRNKTIQLKLTISDQTPLTVVTNKSLEENTHKILSPSEIDRMVIDFKEKELAKLPDESAPLYSNLKQSAENRINSYKTSLINQNQKLTTLSSGLVNEAKNHSSFAQPIGTQRNK